MKKLFLMFVMACVVFGGSGLLFAADNGDLEPVELIWYARMSEPADFEEVMEKFNSKLKEKINATLDLRCVEPADFNQKMQLIMMSGEEYDLTFTSSWANNYYANRERGAYLALNDLLKEHAPNVKEIIPENIWDGLKYKGDLYAVPNYQVMFGQHGYAFKRDLADKYNIDMDKVNTREGFINALQTIKDNEPNITPLIASKPVFLWAEEQEQGISDVEDIFSIDTNTWKVVPHQDNELLLDYYKFVRELNAKGFISPDILTIKNKNREYKTGNYFAKYERYKPGVESDKKPVYGFDIYVEPITEPVVTSGTLVTTLTAINKYSEHPERALMLLDLLYTDKELYNLLIFGIEGKHYEKTGENRIKITDQDSYGLPAWQLGNQFNAYILPGQPDDVWEKTDRLNNQAQKDPLMGFSFDRSKVQVEMASIEAVYEEYKSILENGVVDDVEGTYNGFVEKLNDAGYDKVVKELQKQIDDWRATK